MAKTSAERQREWKERMKAAGRKPIHVMISAEALEILKSEAKRTGETQHDVVDRAILDLAKPQVESAPPVTTNGEKADASVISNTPADKNEVSARIVELREKEGLSFAKIAGVFNAEGLPTLSGKGKWHGRTASKIFHRLKG